MNSREFIIEIANNPYNVELFKNSGRVVDYKFTTDAGIDYYVSFSKQSQNKMNGAYLVFSAGKTTDKTNKSDKNKIGITGTGDQYRVLASVGSAINQYVSTYNPAFITFTAREPSRIGLYNTITRNIGRYVRGWIRGKVVQTPKYNYYTILKQGIAA